MSTSPPIRVIIVDDHPVVRNGIRFSLLAVDDIELVGEAGSGEEALLVCAALQPDVVLMDMVMPGMSGPAATQAIRQRYPQVQVVALTSFQKGELVQQALRAGAISYLLKETSQEDLVRAIRLAHAGQAILTPAATDALLGAANRAEAAALAVKHGLLQRN